MEKLIDSEYQLSIGKKDEERLDLLNEVYNPASSQFLSDILSQTKGHVLELGCGTGILSRIVANIIYPYRVLAVDNHPLQIETAKKKGSIPQNLEFCVSDARDALAMGALYNIIYARFLLVHLNDTFNILNLIKDDLTTDGIVVIEDVESANSQYVNGDSILTKKLLEVDQVQWHELFPKKRIVKQLEQLGFEIVIERSFHPELKTSEHRKLLTWGLESVKDSLISSNLILENQLNELIISSKKLETNFNIKVFYYKMFQIVARKTR